MSSVNVRKNPTLALDIHLKKVHETRVNFWPMTLHQANVKANTNRRELVMDLETLRQIQKMLESQLNTVSNQLLAVKNAIRDAETTGVITLASGNELKVTSEPSTAVDETPKANPPGRQRKHFSCIVCGKAHVARGLCSTHYTAA